MAGPTAAKSIHILPSGLVLVSTYPTETVTLSIPRPHVATKYLLRAVDDAPPQGMRRGGTRMFHLGSSATEKASLNRMTRREQWKFSHYGLHSAEDVSLHE